MTSQTRSLSSKSAKRGYKPVLASLALGFLAACGGGSATEITRSNPNFFLGKVDGAELQMSGVYNPAGFNSSQVRKLVGATCPSGRLSGFGEQPADGLTSFSASCDGGFGPEIGLVEFERIQGSTVLLEITGSDGRGNLLFGKREVTL